MEEMTLRNGTIYYGDKACASADSAYKLFRNDYNASVGRRRNRQLNRIGTRKDRTRGWGAYYDVAVEPPAGYEGVMVPSRLMGIVATAYCRMIGSWDIPDMSEEDTEKFMDWICSHGNRNLRLVGRNEKSGRTSRIYKQ